MRGKRCMLYQRRMWDFSLFEELGCSYQLVSWVDSDTSGISHGRTWMNYGASNLKVPKELTL